MQIAEFSFSSSKLYVTVVVPMLKNEPGSCDLLVIVTDPESSIAVGSNQCTFVPVVLVLSTMFDGQSMIGASMSAVHVHG